MELVAASSARGRRRCGRPGWWARVRGHIYPHVGLLDQHRAPSATARAGTKGGIASHRMAFSPPRIPAHVARGAASEEGEERL